MPALDLLSRSVIIVLHVFHISIFLCLFRLQLIFLFDAFDSATGCVTAIFQCSSSLLHSNNLVARETSQLQLTIEISHGYRNELIVANVETRAGWQRILQHAVDVIVATKRLMSRKILGCSENISLLMLAEWGFERDWRSDYVITKNARRHPSHFLSDSHAHTNIINNTRETIACSKSTKNLTIFIDILLSIRGIKNRLYDRTQLFLFPWVWRFAFEFA